MADVLRFTTALFDVSKERENPINPIPGESLLLWLKDKVSRSHSFSKPEPEDWGWYSYIDWNGRSYLVGSCAYDEENGEREWVLQIEKQRSLAEKLLGRGKMGRDDECSRFIKGLLDSEVQFKGVSFD